jgi:hypothetical protein
MLDKYGKEGLVVLGVTLDDSKDEAARKGVIAYLQKQKVPFTNVNLQGTAETRPKTLDFGVGVPAAFVFNRDNRYVKKLPRVDAKGEPVEDFDYDVIEKLVAELVRKK